MNVTETAPAVNSSKKKILPKSSAKHKRPSTRTRIYSILVAANGAWVPAPALSQIACAYTRCLFELRQQGAVIENRVRYVDGQKHGEYRLLRRDPEKSAAIEYWQSPADTEQQSFAGIGPNAPAWRGDPETGRRP